MCAGVATRLASTDDRAAMLGLCRRALGWKADDPNESFFRWKHDDNVFGPSPTTVAVDDTGRIVGLRAFMRWEFRDPAGATVRAVRAVDTATDPDWQGRGIFTQLTLDALPGLAADDVGAVFNTPNDKSRPGYLKMGWSIVGAVPVSARFRSAGVVRRVLSARTAAELWSEPVDCGIAAATAFADVEATRELIERTPVPNRFTTLRTPAFLDWRYGFAPLHYRVFPLGDSLRDGAIVFRVRRRGGALEVTVGDILAPASATVRRALGAILKECGADYALAIAGQVGFRDGFVPMPRLGPVLTWRPLARPPVPALDEIGLTLGDLELF